MNNTTKLYIKISCALTPLNFNLLKKITDDLTISVFKHRCNTIINIIQRRKKSPISLARDYKKNESSSIEISPF